MDFIWFSRIMRPVWSIFTAVNDLQSNWIHISLKIHGKKFLFFSDKIDVLLPASGTFALVMKCCLAIFICFCLHTEMRMGLSSLFFIDIIKFSCFDYFASRGYAHRDNEMKRECEEERKRERTRASECRKKNMRMRCS